MPSIKRLGAGLVLATGLLAAGAGVYLAGRPEAPIAAAPAGAPVTVANGQSAQAALPGVLTQVYQAFALEDEAAIYDALAQAAAGDLIADLYLQRRAAQVASHSEDGETTILAVEVYEMIPTATEDDAQSFTVAWRVVGRLSHTAHVHERINLYSADITLAPQDGVWKLTRFALTTTLRDDDLDFEGGE